MSKMVFVGVQGQARPYLKGYVGVNGFPKRIRKIYIGDSNGQPKLVHAMWEGNLVYKTGSTHSMFSGFVGRWNMGVTASPSSEIFIAGGIHPEDGAVQSAVRVRPVDNSYTTSLTGLSVARSNILSLSLSNAVFFIGGKYNSTTGSSAVDVYNSTTYQKLSITGLPEASNSDGCFGTTTSDSVLAGGLGTYSSQVVRYSAQAGQRFLYPNWLDTGTKNASAESYGDVSFWAGGEVINDSSEHRTTNKVYRYSNMTKTHLLTLSSPRSHMAAAKAGPYILFAGGYNGYSGEMENTVDVFHSSGTKMLSLKLNTATCDLAGVSTDNNALFAGGRGTSDSIPAWREKKVSVFNSSLQSQIHLNSPNLLRGASRGIKYPGEGKGIVGIKYNGYSGFIYYLEPRYTGNVQPLDLAFDGYKEEV